MSYKPLLEEKFTKDVFARWKQLGGSWETEPDVEVFDVVKRDIYFAPQEPSFVCWATLWKEQGGAIKLMFTEAIGDQSIDPTYDFNSRGIETYLKTLVSMDNGETWKDTGFCEPFDKNHTYNSDHRCRSVFQLEDGALLRIMLRNIKGKTKQGHRVVYDPRFRRSGGHPFRAVRSTMNEIFSCVSRSYDAGRSWTEHTFPFEENLKFHITGVRRLRDGTILAVGSLPQKPDKKDPRQLYDVAFSESHDAGRTWLKPIVVVSPLGVVSPLLWTEELNFAELSDGSVLVLIRVHASYPNPSQGRAVSYHHFYLRKDGHGTWKASEPEMSTLPPSGMPMLIYTTQDALICMNHMAHFFSLDNGATWKQHFIDSSYYPQMVELDDGSILCVTHTDAGDTAFPHQLDKSMKMIRFRYRRSNSILQKDPKATLACTVCTIDNLRDLHLRVEMKVDGCSGIAFRFAEGSKLRYYLYCLMIPVNPTRQSFKGSPGRQEAFALLGKVENNKLTILNWREIYEGLEPGTWCEVQVSAEGSLLKGSFRESSEKAANYVCARDESINKRGGVGLFTDKCTGAFRNLTVWPIVTPMRNIW